MVPFWISFELIFRTRMRGQIHCPNCGFDPFLFVTDEGLAKSEIENHWKKVFAEKGIPYPQKPDKNAHRNPGKNLDEKHS